MRFRPLAVLALLLLATAAPLAAFERGEVYFEHTSTYPGNASPYSEVWVFAPGFTHAAGAGAAPLIYKDVPMFGEGHFFIPAPNEILFHHDQTVSVWDGVNHLFTEPGLGYTELFHDDAELGEIAPMRPGLFLVPERGTAGARLIVFSAQGRVAEIPFPNGLGAEHIELLGDRCTLLYGLGNRVARMNVCTRAALSDFAVLSADESVGSIRQLPDGDVLVASGDAILLFSAGGALLRAYPFAGATRIALTPDGGAFYAAGVNAGKAELRFYGDGQAIPLGNPEMQSITVPLQADDLVVVGEWRAAAQPMPRQRAVR